MSNIVAPEDGFFDQEAGVIRVFDFDHGKIVNFDVEVANNILLCNIVQCPFLIPLYPCCAWLNQENISEKVHKQHAAVTIDGIKFVQEKHKTGCRMDCDERGKTSKTVPFDKITDCDVEEPAGAVGPCCCMTARVLHIVNVDTASGNRHGIGGGHELTLRGLKEPIAFKKLVWAMKRGDRGLVAQLAGAEAAKMLGGNDDHGAHGGGGGGGIAPPNAVFSQGAMKDSEIVPLLERQNELLDAIKTAIEAQTETIEAQAMSRD